MHSFIMTILVIVAIEALAKYFILATGMPLKAPSRFAYFADATVNLVIIAWGLTLL